MAENSIAERDTQLLRLDENKDIASLRKCQLVVVEGHSKGRKIDLKDKAITVGKKEGNDLMLEDRAVSRRHVEIIPEEDSFLLHDLDSTNGTYINETKVKQAYLAPGDIIRVGNSRIEFIAFDEKVQVEPSDQTSFGRLLGRSRRMRQIFGLLERISPTNATVIIEGDTGVGALYFDFTVKIFEPHRPEVLFLTRR